MLRGQCPALRLRGRHSALCAEEPSAERRHLNFRARNRKLWKPEVVGQGLEPDSPRLREIL